MKRFIKFLFTVLSATIFFGCNPIQGDDVVLNNNLEFVLGTPVVNGTEVSLDISHNGTESDTWYCFASEDLTTNASEVISNKITEFLTSGEKFGLRKATKTSITLKNLNPYTEYRGFVFGLTEDGIIYGKMATFTFETQADADAVYQTDDFKITYLGRQEVEENEEDDENEENVSVAETFQIDNPSEKRYYFTTFNDYYLSYYTIEEIVKGEIEYIKTVIQPILKLDQYSLKDATAILQTPEGRQQSGKYTAIAIEFDDKGVATRYFSSAKYEIVEEKAEAAYTKWLGTWELTDAKNVKQTINFEHADNNFFVYVKNWEAGEGYDELPFGENAPFSIFQFPAYYKNGTLEFQSLSLTDVTYNTDDAGYFGIYGTATYEGQTLPVCIDGEVFAHAEFKSETEAVINGAKTQLAGMDFTYESMGYAGFWYVQNGESYKAIGWYDPMVFPINMVKKSGPSEASFKMEKPGEVKMTRFIKTR